MGFKDSIANFLGVPTSNDFGKVVEELAKRDEELAIKDRLLQNIEEKSAGSVTYSSSVAREVIKSEDPQGVVVKRIPIKDLQLLYINNQFIFRGVNVRADELVTRGFSIIGGDETGREACAKLIENSGGVNLLWQLSVNTDVCGDGYLELVPNQAKTAILKLKHINPINFGFETEENDRSKIKVDASGEPVGYQQVVTNQEGKEVLIKVPKERIAHLRFNTFGDEFNGISSLQPVFNTSIRLMNMEHAAAEAAVKTANPTWVVMTKSKSVRDLNQWSQALDRISAKEVVFLPDEVKIELKSPGNQNFSDYAGYFLDAVVAALGVPKSILTGASDSGGGNRATVQTLSRHFASVVRSNQRYVEEMFDNIFKRYASIAKWKDVPQFVFNDIAEDADANGQRAVDLYANNIVTLEEARDMIGLESTPDKLDEITSREQVMAAKGMVPKPGEPAKSNIDPNKEAKAQDMKAWHPASPGKPAGSQKGVKAKATISSA